MLESSLLGIEETLGERQNRKAPKKYKVSQLTRNNTACTYIVFVYLLSQLLSVCVLYLLYNLYWAPLKITEWIPC